MVGLYLDPPERAVVFSFDEKTQCQALDCTAEPADAAGTRRNAHPPKPFVWRKIAEEIIEKVRRGRAALHQVHATPHH